VDQSSLIDELMAGLHEDFSVRVERIVGDRFPAGRAFLTARPGTASELTLEACRSLSCDPRRAFPAAAMIHAAFIAIALVDEVLDEEPRADLSAGGTANLASVAQALAFCFLPEIAPPARVAVATRIARMLVDTAWGQERDVSEITDAGDTWSIAAAKTAPLFEAAMFCGALAGGAPEQLATEIEEFGRFVGRIVQIQDDLTDALEPGSDSDWRPPISNVVLRFALHVDHPDRTHVRQLMTVAAHEGDARDEIRRILGVCGAIEYGMSSVLFYASEARRYLERHPLERRFLTEFLDRQTAPTSNLLAGVGANGSDVSRHLVKVFGGDVN
jgi:hypothetical protein